MKPAKSKPNSISRELRILENQNKELDRFVYSASHDLKAPLRSIMGIVSIARTETTDEVQQNYLNMIQRSASKLDNFINDLVNFSRNSRLEIKSEAIDFRTMVDEILEELSHMDNNTNLQVSTEIKGSECKSDPSRMKIIFSNMISNAIKYQNRSKGVQPMLHISVHSTKTKTVLTFEDNGEGISKENQKKVFDMFYRASDQSYGSGLGLYIVAEVTKKLRGKIKLESEQGKGTKFTFTFAKKPNKNKLHII